MFGGGLLFLALGAFLLWIEKDASEALVKRLRMPPPDKQVVVLIGAGFVICGAWMLIGAPAPAFFGVLVSVLALIVLARDLWQLRDAARWPRATAKVTESRVTSTIQERQGLPNRTLYGALIRYTYDTGAGEVRSWNGSFDGVSLNAGREAAEATVREHPIGSSIEVRYNPRKPDRSVLGNATIPQTKLWMTAGFVAMLALSCVAVAWPS